MAGEGERAEQFLCQQFPVLYNRGHDRVIPLFVPGQKKSCFREIVRENCRRLIVQWMNGSVGRSDPLKAVLLEWKGFQIRGRQSHRVDGGKIEMKKSGQDELFSKF